MLCGVINKGTEPLITGTEWIDGTDRLKTGTTRRYALFPEAFFHVSKSFDSVVFPSFFPPLKLTILVPEASIMALFPST